MSGKPLNLLIINLLVFMTAGCAITPSHSVRPPDTSISEQSLSDKGLGGILVSFTAELKDGTEQVNGAIFFRPVGAPPDSDRKLKMYSENPVALLGLLTRSRDFQDVNGKLLFEPLEPGQYILTGWYVDGGNGSLFTPRELLDPIPFEVKKGEIVYLGNAHLSLSTGRDMLDNQTASGAWLEISDMHDRDLSLAHRLYPRVDSFVQDVIDGETWSIEYVQSKDSSSEISQ